MKLLNKSILLTGGGTGIGRSLALEFGKRGAKLTLIGRRSGPLSEVADTLQMSGIAVHTIAADITDYSTHETIVSEAVRRFGDLHCVVNNAGAVRASRLEALEVSEILTMVSVNLIAPILLTRAALPALRRSTDGLVVNITSGNALIGMPFYGPYAAAKAGLARFGESLRRELSGEGVNVITVYPGPTDTPMMATSSAGPDLGFELEAPEAVARSIVDAIESGTCEVLRASESRRRMIELNRRDPAAVDGNFAKLKTALERAVQNHRAL